MKDLMKVCILVTRHPQNRHKKEYRVGEVDRLDRLTHRPNDPDQERMLHPKEAQRVFGRCRPFNDIKHAQGYSWAWQDGGQYDEEVAFLDFGDTIFPTHEAADRPVSAKRERELTAA